MSGMPFELIEIVRLYKIRITFESAKEHLKRLKTICDADNVKKPKKNYQIILINLDNSNIWDKLGDSLPNWYFYTIYRGKYFEIISKGGG